MEDQGKKRLETAFVQSPTAVNLNYEFRLSMYTNLDVLFKMVWVFICLFFEVVFGGKAFV